MDELPRSRIGSLYRVDNALAFDFDITLHIQRPIDDVFRFVGTDHFVNHPKWDKAMVALRPITPPPLRAGSVAETERRFGWQVIAGRLEILSIEENRSIRTISQYRESRLEVACNLSEESRFATRVSLVARYSESGLLRFKALFLRPMIVHNFVDTLITIRRLLESRGA